MGGSAGAVATAGISVAIATAWEVAVINVRGAGDRCAATTWVSMRGPALEVRAQPVEAVEEAAVAAAVGGTGLRELYRWKKLGASWLERVCDSVQDASIHLCGPSRIGDIAKS